MIPVLPNSGEAGRRVYSYEVVTFNGCGVHARGFKRCADARAAMERIAARWSLPDEVFEIQRVQHIGGNRRYWMRRRSRWVPSHHLEDHTVRHPDWYAISARSCCSVARSRDQPRATLESRCLRHQPLGRRR